LGSDNDGDPEDLIRHAQFAVKRAKTSGRTEVYHTRAFDIAREQFGIETELRRAIENGQMTLSFQPICDLATGKIVSFEALARWTNEDGVEAVPQRLHPRRRGIGPDRPARPLGDGGGGADARGMGRHRGRRRRRARSRSISRRSSSSATRSPQW
jgi:hypothetical protein